MNYINNAINENNYNLFFDKQEGFSAEKRIANFIFAQILIDSFSLVNRDKNIKKLEILHYSDSGLNIIFNNKDEKLSLFDIQTQEYKRNIEYKINYLKNFVSNSLFLNPEFIENFQIPETSALHESKIINSYIDNNTVENEEELKLLFSSLEDDIKCWNENSFKSDDFSFIYFSVNSILKYKKDKLFKLLLCELLSEEKNLVLINDGKRLLLNFEINNSEKKETIEKLNLFLNNPCCDLFKQVEKENNKILDTSMLDSIYLYDYPASYANKMDEFMKPVIAGTVKTILSSLVSSSQINTHKINRI